MNLLAAVFYFSGVHGRGPAIPWPEALKQMGLVAIILLGIFWGIPLMFLWWSNRDTPKKRAERQRHQELLDRLQKEYGSVKFNAGWNKQDWNPIFVAPEKKFVDRFVGPAPKFVPPTKKPKAPWPPETL